MKALIIGLGFGNLYVDIYKELGWEVVTVDPDPNKKSTYESLLFVKNDYLYNKFDTAHICTPNYTHEGIARTIFGLADIIFIEKPGVETSKKWELLYKDGKKRGSKILMVKNNQYRDNIDEILTLTDQSEKIKIKWMNQERVPNPGSWFTNKHLSYGGVSRDLMPHLLSVLCLMNPSYKNLSLIDYFTEQNTSLDKIKKTEYGVVNPNGIYNVDDRAYMKFENERSEFILEASWWHFMNDSCIEFRDYKNWGRKVTFGFCPNEAYEKMILETIKHQSRGILNWFWWDNQYQQDLWIHQQLEKLSGRNINETSSY